MAGIQEVQLLPEGAERSTNKEGESVGDQIQGTRSVLAPSLTLSSKWVLPQGTTPVSEVSKDYRRLVSEFLPRWGCLRKERAHGVFSSPCGSLESIGWGGMEPIKCPSHFLPIALNHDPDLQHMPFFVVSFPRKSVCTVICNCFIVRNRKCPIGGSELIRAACFWHVQFCLTILLGTRLCWTPTSHDWFEKQTNGTPCISVLVLGWIGFQWRAAVSGSVQKANGFALQCRLFWEANIDSQTLPKMPALQGAGFGPTGAQETWSGEAV
nr:hypothetical protein GOBAR_AA34543 [Ipomoea batatas]